MAIGPAVRRALGPLEPPIAWAYRRAFFDLALLADSVARLAPARILEVGCGEGAVASALLARLPAVRYVGLDVRGTPGRLFRGDAGRAEFVLSEVSEFTDRNGGAFDLVVACDVLHHVEPGARAPFLRAAVRALARGGTFVLKDWERSRSLVHALAWASDRFVTGDAVRYETLDGLRTVVRDALPELVLGEERRFAPWSNNVALFLKKP